MVEQLRRARAHLPGRPARLVGLASAACVVALVQLRLFRDGVASYGADGAQYLEHAARLSILQHVRSQESLNPWGLLVTSDGAYPPLMHLASLPLGAIFGHSAEAVSATAVLWLLLLAVAVGWLTAGLTGRSSLAAPAATSVLLVPALHGSATRYYYDLPMIALLWLAAALLLVGRDRMPLRAGAAAGGVFFAACVTKWAAIPFGAPLLLGALLVSAPPVPGASTSGPRDRWRGRGLCGLVCAAVTTVLCLGFLHGREGDNSFAGMSRNAFAEGTPTDWEGNPDAPGALASVVSRAVDRGASLEAPDFVFYPLRLVTAVLSPALTVVLVCLLFLWWRSSRRGALLVAAVLAGHAVFLLGVMPVLDDRFALAGLPVLLVAGTLGWASLESRPRFLVATGVLGLGAVLALEFHFGPPGPWNEAREVLVVDRDDFPPSSARGLVASSSVEERGWSRGDEQAARPRRKAFRDVVWGAVQRCGVQTLGVAVEEPVIDPLGDLEWFRYRSLLEQLEGSGAALDVVQLCGGDGPFQGGVVPDLVVTASASLPGCLAGSSWRRVWEIADPGESGAALLWVPEGSSACAE